MSQFPTSSEKNKNWVCAWCGEREPKGGRGREGGEETEGGGEGREGGDGGWEGGHEQN